ncbi:retrovirus-related Pol polyprotein from transposon 17.6 [Trichonephila clavipes]|nr:retrovirus-related Pol polyprotein from transposon 17.6 [Trichonephila clavipes]
MPTEQEAKPAVVTPSLQQWRSPSTFRGAPGEDPLKWLKEYDRVANFNKWDDMMCLANVYFFLDGTARQWYVNNEDALDSWEAFKNGISGLFGDRQKYTRRAEQLKYRAQRSGESTQSYIQGVLGLCQEVNPLIKEDEKVSHLMKGVAEDIYQALLTREINDTASFIKWCNYIEDMKQKRVGQPKFERLPNVVPVASLTDETDLVSLIRTIVREEVHRLVNQTQEYLDSDPQSLEEIIQDEVERVLAPVSTKPTETRPRPTGQRPFGLCNAPATFERMMDNLLRHFKWTMCLCYLDDIIVFSETFEDHLIRLRFVLKCLQEAGLKLNSKKCLFAAQEVKILGHLVSSNGVRPDPDKIKAVRNFPTPKNIHDIRSFLGLCSYFRRFIKGFCYLAEPLQSLLKSGVEFHWGPEEVEAFHSLKKALTSDPVLGMYDERASTEIHTDASGYGIGAVLVQIQNNVEKVIAYASRTLTKAEKNYSTTERECLAIVWTTNKFQPYIFGKHFTVVTDHHSLCWLMNLKDPSGRLARWALRLQEHDFDVKYKTGKKHSDADALSRNPVEEETETPDKFLAVTTSMNLAMEQKKNHDLAKLKLLSNSFKNEEFRFIDGILCRKNFDPDGKVVVTSHS